MTRTARPLLSTFMLLAVLAPPVWAQPPAGRGQPRLGPVTLPEGTIVHRDLAYVTSGHERQKLDLYLPGGGRNLALVVMIHGGAFRGGSKDGENPVPMLAEGYAVAAINYRLSQHAIWPAQTEDCKAAVRWLRAKSQWAFPGMRTSSGGPGAVKRPR